MWCVVIDINTTGGAIVRGFNHLSFLIRPLWETSGVLRYCSHMQQLCGLRGGTA